MRRVVATISYEVQFNLNLVLFILYHKRIILKDIGLVVNITFFLTFMISLLVELRRTPFDYVERERDLVRGFNTEYRRVSFVLLFLKEYGSLLFFSLLTSVLFFGGYFIVGVFIFWLLIFIRSRFPRLRIDKLMGLM